MLHKDQIDNEPNEEGQILAEDNPSTRILSPLKSQQLNFGSTSDSNQGQTKDRHPNHL